MYPYPKHWIVTYELIKILNDKHLIYLHSLQDSHAYTTSTTRVRLLCYHHCIPQVHSFLNICVLRRLGSRNIWVLMVQGFLGINLNNAYFKLCILMLAE